MPAMMKCPTCGFEGPHGFNEPGVGGIMMFYHSAPSGTCRSFTVNNKWFTSKAEAWKEVRPLLVADRADPDWLAAWDARIIEGDEKKFERLIQKWRDSH